MGVTSPFPRAGSLPAWGWGAELTSHGPVTLLKTDLPFFSHSRRSDSWFLAPRGWWKAAPEKVGPINGSNPGPFLLVMLARC